MEPHAGVTEADLAAHEARMAARARAHAAPLPGPMRQAFAGDPPTAAGIPLRPVVLGDFETLELLDHPLRDVVAQMLTGELKNVRMDLNRIREAIYLWSHPSADCRRLAGDAQAFRKAAAEATKDVPFAALPDCIQSLVANLMAGFAPQVAHQAPPQEGREVFPPGHQPTGLDGGSTSTARSCGNSTSTP